MRWFKELRRRGVFHVAAVYLIAAWVTLQVADVTLPAMGFAPWSMTLLTTLAIVGFPFSLILGWFFDFTKDGITRTLPAGKIPDSDRESTLRAIDYSILAATTVILAIIAFGIFDKISSDQLLSDELLGSKGFEPLANSIAVLPFVDMSADKSNEHFTDGISDVLIHQISQISELHVISRTSSFSFKGQNTDVREIGRKLNVGKVLEGSVQRADGKIRIAAQLIDTHSGAHVWSQLFDRDEKDIFDIQDEISLEVADAMVVNVAQEELTRVTRDITNDLDAYDLYLLGQHHIVTSKGVGSFETSISHLENALTIDPNFALAWSGIAAAYILHAMGGGMPMDEALENSREAIDRALQIDPNLGEAHASNILHAFITGDINVARESYDLATKLSPSHWVSYLWYGTMLFNDYNVNTAANVFSAGLKFEPLEPLLRASLADVMLERGDYESGISLHQSVYLAQTDPELSEQYLWSLGYSALFQNRFDDAIGYAQLSVSAEDNSEMPAITLAMANLAIGDTVEARKWIDEADRVSQQERGNRPEISVFDMRVDGAKAHFFRVTEDVSALEKLAESTILLTATEPEYGYLSGISYFYLGRYDVASENLELVVSVRPDVEGCVLLAYAYARRGEEFQEEADKYLAKALELIDRGIGENIKSPLFLKDVAAYWAAKQDTAETIRYMREAFNAGFRDYNYVSVMPVFDKVREDPRFSTIIEEMQDDALNMRRRVEEAREAGTWRDLVELGSE